MDKNPGITCVVNKTNIIDSTYRNFKMEVLAGEENMVAKVSEMVQSFYDTHLPNICSHSHPADGASDPFCPCCR